MQPRGSGIVLIGVIVAECLLTIVFVCLRGWARIRLLSGFRYDDYILWAATAFLIAMTGDTIAAVYYGLGRHRTDLELEDLVAATPYLFAYPALLTFSLFVGKAAVVAFLLMLVVEKLHKIILWVSIGILGLLSSLEFIGLFVQCLPVEANWNPFSKRDCHFNVTLVGYFLTGYGAFLDFFLAALPWFFFSSLQVKRKEKIVVCISLSTGILAGVCGIIRLIELYKLQTNPDRFYASAAPMMWTNTETCVSIICVCLSVSRTLYRRYRKGLRVSPDSTGATTEHQSNQNSRGLQDRFQNQTGVHTRIWSDRTVDLEEQQQDYSEEDYEWAQKRGARE